VGGIKEAVAFEHGNKDPQKSIGDTAQCAGIGSVSILVEKGKGVII
jgi:hypothetical protein